MTFNNVFNNFIHRFMLNTHFNEEDYIVEGDLEKSIPKSEFLSKLLQLYQLPEPFHQTLC